MTADELWQNLSHGKSGIDTITAFDPVNFTCKIAGQIPDFKIRDFIPKAFRKSTKLMSRDIEIAIIAAKQAVESSAIVTKGIDPENVDIDPTRFAINLGAGLISCDLVELAPAVAQSITDGDFDIKKWGSDGLNYVTPLWLLKYLPNMLPCHIGLIHDIQGPSNTITCAETGAHMAIAEAAQIIARNDADIALAGGVEAKVNPIVMIRQCLTKRTADQANDNPKSACRPFDADAKGSVFGEAGAMFLLEEALRAKNRNAKIYAEIMGTGSANSINPQYQHLEPDGTGIKIAIQQALKEAGISADMLDLIIPHGSAIPQDDKAEAAAIEALLGPAVSKVPVWPTKSMLSNTGAAAGAVDLVAAVYAMQNKTIPAAINCENKAQWCNLNIPRSPINKEIKYALSCSYTYGGQTAAVILKNSDS
jgi:3-oxoacyl-[acyl-carrier-protein] synthase II